jgi:histidinol-phosphate aminotransferase
MNLSIDTAIRQIPFYPKAALYGADGDWVRLASNENPYPPSTRVVEALVNALLDMNRYPESEYELKRLLAAKYGVAPENVLIGNGSNEMIEAALRGVRLDGRNGVVVTDHSFSFYRIAAHIYGYEVTSVPLDRSLGLDFGRLLDAVDGKTRVVFLCNPNNPTGGIFKDRDFAAFLAKLPPEVLVVIDEAYAEFSDSGDFPRSVTYIDRYPVLMLRTFSKAHGLAGLRVGYAGGDASLVSFLERTKQPFSVNMMALIAARAALGDEGHVGRVLENIRKGKEYLYAALTALGLEFLPSEANFILIRIGPDAEGLTKRLFDKKRLIRWLGGYGLPDCIRVTVGTMKENRAFIDGMKTMRG